MKIIVDDKIPYIKGALEPFAEVIYAAGKNTTPEMVKDADALITRTRTICDKNLLKSSSVKMIATATIGFDHIDTNYCKKNGIDWTNAPGCNSWSVAQYMMSALFYIAKNDEIELKDKTIGIIGVGQVGSKIAKLCKLIGMKVLLNDPPRARIEGDKDFVSLKEIQENADFITVHTPLTNSGQDKTFHLINDQFINSCLKDIYFINAARGEIMDTRAILDGLATSKIVKTCIDCWENEPEINLELLSQSFIATPHIAGYSKDGKANGTKMSVQALSRKFNLGIDNWEPNQVELPANTEIEVDGTQKKLYDRLSAIFFSTYPIWEDVKRLKSNPDKFEKLRGNYPVRREFPVYTIKGKNLSFEELQLYSEIGFQVIN